jgi:hypothetical protein
MMIYGRGRIAPLFFTWHWIEVRGQLNTPADSPPGKESPVPLNRRLGQLQIQSGCCEEELGIDRVSEK